MRAFELRRFSPLRCANVIAVVSFFLYGVVGLIVAPLMAGGFAIMTKLAETSAATNHSPMPTLPPMWLPLAVALLYPAMGTAMGWIFGGLGALAYNLVVRFTGGIQVQFVEAAVAPLP
jgi:hypothetical protein